jgi:hypothetical protein
MADINIYVDLCICWVLVGNWSGTANVELVH